MTHQGPVIKDVVSENATTGRGHPLIRMALDVLLPPQCLGCGTLIESPGLLCRACWKDIVFPGTPQCEACGLPFEYDYGDGAMCAACIRRPPVFQRARAAMVYGDTSRKLILSFKHGDRTDVAPAFGLWLARAGKELIADADLIVPVPLHWTRLFSRLYNQAALLGREVGNLAGVPMAPDLLIRRKATPSQGRVSLSARRRNVRGVFAVRPSRRQDIQGLRALLIDDVMTTGATVTACARTLLKAGAEAVDVLTLARVVRPEV